jgi:hypothetical protein
MKKFQQNKKKANRKEVKVKKQMKINNKKKSIKKYK